MTTMARRIASATKRRKRRSDSTNRAPMPAQVARPLKRDSGSTVAAHTPVFIRAVGVVVDEADRAYLRRKLGRKLGKFARPIERISVRIEDVNAERGGVDKRCRIKVVLSGLPSVVVDQQHHALQAAMDFALDRIQMAVRRALQRRRLKPVRARNRTAV
jgi:ribosome-associated translation inhibitor RaiA